MTKLPISALNACERVLRLRLRLGNAPLLLLLLLQQLNVLADLFGVGEGGAHAQLGGPLVVVDEGGQQGEQIGGEAAQAVVGGGAAGGGGGGVLGRDEVEVGAVGDELDEEAVGGRDGERRRTRAACFEVDESMFILFGMWFFVCWHASLHQNSRCVCTYIGKRKMITLAFHYCFSLFSL
jgi:hypothetical protein